MHEHEFAGTNVFRIHLDFRKFALLWLASKPCCELNEIFAECVILALWKRFRNFENMLRIFAFHEKVNWIYFRQNIFLFDDSKQFVALSSKYVLNNHPQINSRSHLLWHQLQRRCFSEISFGCSFQPVFREPRTNIGFLFTTFFSV